MLHEVPVHQIVQAPITILLLRRHLLQIFDGTRTELNSGTRDWTGLEVRHDDIFWGRAGASEIQSVHGALKVVRWASDGMFHSLGF